MGARLGIDVNVMIHECVQLREYHFHLENIELIMELEDGLPNIVMEALASGTALVATDVGGIGAVVRDRETGLIVPERDGAALARAIMALLDDRDARLALGRAARTDVCLRHTWERFAERLEQIYDAVRNVAHARPVTVC